MTLFVILSSIITIIILLVIVNKISYYIHKSKFYKEDDKFKVRLGKEDLFLLLLAILLIIFSLFSPYLFTRESASKDFDFTQTGPIGDTIGGLMSPFINVAAVIVTGLAFYMQYKANKLQVEMFKEQLNETQNQFKKEQEKQQENYDFQQFENQFYEMLKLHKENVNEIEIKAVSGDFLKGRMVFYEMKKELEVLHVALEEYYGKSIDDNLFMNAYEKFFWGFGGEVMISKKTLKESDFGEDSFEADLLKIKEGESAKKLFEAEILKRNLKIPFLEGHHGYLGHYYRHLFQTVKFVVSKNFLSYEQKLNYLRILRAQLSNYEQVMLFYNWISEYGEAWENKDNNFLTKYRMIHNLWYEDLLDKKFFTRNLKKLVNIYKKFGYNNALFEMGDSKITEE